MVNAVQIFESGLCPPNLPTLKANTGRHVKVNEQNWLQFFFEEHNYSVLTMTSCQYIFLKVAISKDFHQSKKYETTPSFYLLRLLYDLFSKEGSCYRDQKDQSSVITHILFIVSLSLNDRLPLSCNHSNIRCQQRAQEEMLKTRKRIWWVRAKTFISFQNPFDSSSGLKHVFPISMSTLQRPNQGQVGMGSDSIEELTRCGWQVSPL